MLKVAALVVLGFLGVSPCLQALTIDPPLADPVLETRAQDLAKGLRCLVCQNQSIADSDAPLAGDLRQIVRERLAAGATDQQVRDYLVARYGDWVLLDPPLERRTWLLWFAPAGVLLLGAGGIAFLVLRRRRMIPSAVPLNPDEAAEVKKLMEGL